MVFWDNKEDVPGSRRKFWIEYIVEDTVVSIFTHVSHKRHGKIWTDLIYNWGTTSDSKHKDQGTGFFINLYSWIPFQEDRMNFHVS